MVVVSREVSLVDVEVVVFVEFPELAVDHIEMFVGEEIFDLVDVVLVLQSFHSLNTHREGRGKR